MNNATEHTPPQVQLQVQQVLGDAATRHEQQHEQRDRTHAPTGPTPTGDGRCCHTLCEQQHEQRDRTHAITGMND